MIRAMVLLILTVSCLAAVNPVVATPGLHLQLSTDQQVYHIGEPIAVALTVVNQNTQAYQALFPSSQIYDLILTDLSGKKVWQWSDGKLFAQVFTPLTFEPYLPKTWSVLIAPSRQTEPALPPGIYHLTGVLEPTGSHWETQPLEIEIRK